MDRTLERSTMRKVYLRLLPFAILSYVLAYIDRINVSFAGLTMRTDLEMSAGTFGFAIGMFFWGYFIFEVPSNVILEKIGARIWIARIMITWGILAGLTAVVTGSTSFGIVRFLLGVAEAGFFPGIILYFTYWFPSHHHARIVSGFLIGLPFAVAVGAPISTALLGLDGLFGLKGWQVMYIAEAIPTVIIGVITFFVLTDRPEQARFLTAEERHWLVSTIAAERRATEAVRKFTLWQALYNPKVLLLALNYFGIVTASLGMLYFIPQMIKSLGDYSNMTVGWLTMIPYTCGAIAMVTWGAHLRSHERAALESVHRLRVLDRRASDRRHDDGDLVGAGGNVDRRNGLLRLQGSVLRHAADVPQWRRTGGGHCLDQLDRQSRRLLRSVVCRRYEGPDRQLCGRPLWARIPRFDGGHRLRAVFTHSETRAGGGERACRMTLECRVECAEINLRSGRRVMRHR
ncbi:MAG TPA: MFS transporter [Bradyrhizobium sp.]|nr:MFS transporter [Bradyrhizobium sp.]